MEELFVYALLLNEDLITEEEYRKQLDQLFLDDPQNDDLLYLEWETDLQKAIVFIRTEMDCSHLNLERFGRFLMGKLKGVYVNCVDLKWFAGRMYRLWEGLPGSIQSIEPFWMLCYADDPLSWGDEAQSRSIYEAMLDYYQDETRLEHM